MYGRTVNIASRIASVAQGGQVVASGETVGAAAEAALDAGIHFGSLGASSLKGLATDIPLFRASREPRA